MNRSTGRSIEGLEHLRQSVGDILSTPIGSRVMRRSYGSLVPALIDQPDNRATRVRINAAIAGALMRWEPRLQLLAIKLTRDTQVPGRVQITLTGKRTNSQPAPLALQITMQASGGWS